MKLHVALRMPNPGLPIDVVIKWLLEMRESGFTENATVKVGKTTGQKPVMVINETKQIGGWTPTPISPTPSPEMPSAPMWGDDD